MNESEAIKIIEKDRDTKCDTLDALPESARKNAIDLRNMIEAEAMAVIALETQIPKKPVLTKEFMTYAHCPVCNEVLPFQQNYCGECGQHIDWTVEK